MLFLAYKAELVEGAWFATIAGLSGGIGVTAATKEAAIRGVKTLALKVLVAQMECGEREDFGGVIIREDRDEEAEEYAAAVAAVRADELL